MSSTKEITLKSAEGEIFKVVESVAMQLGTVKSFLEETDSSEVVMPIPNVRSKTLRQILRFSEKKIETPEKTEKETFEEVFLNELITNQDLKEMLLGANYLNCKGLLEVLFQTAADRIKNRSVEYARRFFEVESDFTPEEEEKLRQENLWAFEGVDPDDDDDDDDVVVDVDV